MKSTKIIIKALGATYWNYDNLRHAYFLHWCNNMCDTHYLPFSTLCSCEPLKNWYLDQWHTLVAGRIVKQMSDLIPYMKPKDMEYWLGTYADELSNIYPSAIIKKLRKTFNNNLNPAK